jgi:hypothetical protein
MNRFKLPQPYVPGMLNLLEWKECHELAPTISEMESFASQFTEKEWMRLCQNNVFISAIDCDLEEARVRAEAILHRRVSAKLNLLKV